MSKQHPVASTRPGHIAALLAGFTFFLIFAHLLTHFLRGIHESALLRGLSDFFFLDREMNAPTFFCAGLFVINSVLFFEIWKRRHVRLRSTTVWLILSLLFFFLAIDELLALHEELVVPVRSMFGLSGVFYFAWIVPYGIAVAMLSLFVIPTIWRIDRKVRFWLILSAVTFFTGTIVFEMLEGWYIELTDNLRDRLYFLFMTLEESLEMLGLVMLTYALAILLRIESDETAAGGGD